MQTLKKYGIGILVLTAWASQLVPLLLASEGAVDKTAATFQQYANENKDSITQMNQRALTGVTVDGVEARTKTELWSKRNRSLAIAVIGVVSGLMALFSIRFWRIAVIATSLLYLGFWYSSGSTASAPLLKAYELKWMTAQTLGTSGSFIQMDVALPLIYLFVVIFISAQIALSYRKAVP